MAEPEDLENHEPAEDLDASGESGGGLPQAIIVQPRAPGALPGPQPRNWMPAPGAQPQSIIGVEPAPASKQGTLKDYGDRAWASTLGMGEDLLGYASLLTRNLTQSPAAVAWIQEQRRALGDHVEKTVQGMSPAGQQALHAQLFGGGNDEEGNHIPTPGEVGWGNYVGGVAADFVPQGALAVLPQSVVRGWGGMVISSGLFGAQQAGQAYNALIDRIDKAKPEDMMGSPVYAHAREQGMDDVTARRLVVDKMTPFLSAQFAVGAAAGAGIGGILTRGAGTAAGASMVRRAGIGAAEGAATMGGQAGAGNVLDQVAAMQAGTQKNYDLSQTLATTAAAGIGGAVLGAAAGVLHRGREAPTPVSDVAPDHQAALAEVLMLPPPSRQLEAPATSTPPMLTFQPDRTRGDTFSLPLDGSGGPPYANQQQLPASARQLTFNPDRTRGDGFTLSTPERAEDLTAQVAALSDPTSPRDAVFVAKGSPMPQNIPAGAKIVPRAAGVLITTNDAKAADFRRGPVDETKLASVLGFPETRQQAVSSGAPHVVQSVDGQGRVVAEMAASPQGVPAATAIAQAHAPEGEVRVTSPIDAQMRRLVPASDHPVDQAAAQATQPTPAQAEAGNYQKGHLKFKGLDISVETPKGDVRKGPIDPNTNQPAWQTTMPAHYGYVRGTIGGDGEPVDVHLGPRTKAMFDGTPADAAREPVYVVDQVDPKTNKFDEHKAMLGFHTALDAAHAYDASFSDGSGPTRRGAVTEMNFEQFKNWLKGDTTKAVAYKAPTKGGLIRQQLAQNKARLAPQEAPERGVVRVGKAEDATKRFLTAKGSTYEVHPDGTTTRNKSYHPEHGERDQGPQPRSEATVYVTAKDAQALGEVQTQGSGRRAVAPLGDGRWGVKYLDGPNAGKFERRTVVTPETAPRAGLTPVEIFKGGESVHFGNEIVAERAAKATPPGLAALLTKRPDTRMSREAAEEARTQPAVHERADTTTVVEEPGVEKQRSSLTTNKDRLLSDLESKVANNLMTATEADAEYGRKQPGTGGRARAFPDFASWIRDRIEKLSDPKVQEDIVARATRLQNDKTLQGAKRNAAVRAINDELARTDPDYVDRLRTMLADMEHPGGEAASRAERKQSALEGIRTAKDKLTRKMPAPEIERLFMDRRINQPIAEPLARAQREGTTLNARDLLDAVARDPVIGVRLPQTATLARRLHELIPDNARVIDQDRAVALYPKGDFRGADAMYLPAELTGGAPVIAVHSDPGYGHTGVFLHEALHAVTEKYIRELPETSRDAKLLQEIHLDLMDRLNADPSVDTAGLIDYALQDFHELHTMLMSDPVVQEFAAGMRPSPELRNRLAAYGYNSTETTSLWRAFTGWVRRALGLPPNSGSLLDHIMRPLQDITDRAAEYNRTAALPEDSALRSAAGPTLDAASHSMRMPGRREVIDRIDPGRLTDTGRRAIIQGATSDQILKFNRDLFETYDPVRAAKIVEDNRQLSGFADAVKTASGIQKILSTPDASRVHAAFAKFWEAGRKPSDNLLEVHRTAYEAMAARSKDFHDQFADRVKDLTTKFAKLPPAEQEKLATLMNDVTLAQVHLGPNATNAHLTAPAQLAPLKGLQVRYDALTPEAKQTYHGIAAYNKETHIIERTGQLAAIIKTMLPDATMPQVRALAEAARTKRGIDGLINAPDRSPVAAAFADAWNSKRQLVRLIAKAHSYGFVQGDFFHLRRHGDYVVHYGTKGMEDYGVEMFERKSAAEARRAELDPEGVEPSQVLDKNRSKMRTMIPGTVMDELDAAIRHSTDLRGDQADAVKDLFASVMMQHATRSEAARHNLRRHGVKGASTDVVKGLSQDFLSMSSRVGYLEHGPERAQALAALQRHATLLGREGKPNEQIRANAVVHELQLRQPAGDDASGAWTAASRKLSQMGFVYSLMSPSHMFTSTAEAHTNSIAMMGARHGYARAMLSLTKSLADITPTMARTGVKNTFKSLTINGLRAADWNLSTVVRDRLIAGGANQSHMNQLFRSLNNAGLIDHTWVRELRRISNPVLDITRGWWGKFMDFNAAGAHAVDVANKTAIAKAAFDMELRKNGGDVGKAIDYATGMARDAMPNYNLANKSRISTSQGALGGFAAPLTQFKQYGIHMYSVMSVLLRQSVHGASKAERREAQLAFGGIMATHALMAGTLTWIADPLRYFGGTYDLFTGASAPHDYQNDARIWLSEMFGKTVGEILARGLLHWLLGIDVHRRVGLSNLLEVPSLKTFDAKGLMETIAAAVTGAAGEDATKIAEGMMKMFSGDIGGGLKDMVPRVARDVGKAYLLNEHGVTDSKGRTILPRAQLSNADIAAQAIGFQPSRVSEFREGRAAVLEARNEAQAARSKALTAFTTAGDAGDRQKALEQVRAYNQANPRTPINYDQLLQAQKRQQDMVRRPATFGLQIPKKAVPAYAPHGAFANTQ